MTALAVTCLAFLLGMALLFLGRRGRAVGDHPHCRRCGFDLFAKPADSTRCPECGASLDKPRSTRIGHREPRRALVWIGAILILPSVLATAVLLFAFSQGSRAASWKPGPWLATEVTSNNADLREAAIAEVSKRIRDHKLSRWSVKIMANEILAAQADPNKPWDRKGWGGLIEEAHGLPPGEHDFCFQMDGQVTSEEDNIAAGAHRDAKPLAPRKVEMHARFTLLPPGESSVIPKGGAAIDAAVKKAAAISLSKLADDDEGASLDAVVNFKECPLPVAYIVYLRVSGKEWRAGEFAFEKTPNRISGRWNVSGFHPKDPDKPLKVDLILRPDREGAVRTLDIADFADVEVILKDQIIWPKQ